ncbi:MAG: metallophosphoesterase [Victivallales bacterium]|nr:metallophosphoesterase [Victivallales bacterium]
MRLLHFSDIHCGIFPSLQDARFDKRWLGGLNHWLRRRAFQDWSTLPRLAEHIQATKPDLVICSGDLTSIGTPEEFALARNCLKPILEASAGHFLYVPGNHDCYLADAACQQALSETYAALNGAWNQLDELPGLHRFGDIEIVCLQQCQPRPWYSSSGLMDEEQWQALRQMLDTPVQGIARLGLGHFPFRGAHGNPLGAQREFAGWGQLLECLRWGGVAAWLCGHIHRGFCRTEPEGVQVFCAGSLTLHRQWIEIDIDSQGNCQGKLTQEKTR